MKLNSKANESLVERSLGITYEEVQLRMFPRMWLETSEIISLSSDAIFQSWEFSRSHGLHGYAYLWKRMRRPSVPVATVPFLPTNASGMARTFAHRGNSASPKRNSVLHCSPETQVRSNRWCDQKGKEAFFLFAVSNSIKKSTSSTTFSLDQNATASLTCSRLSDSRGRHILVPIAHVASLSRRGLDTRNERALGKQDFEVLDFRISGHVRFKVFKKFQTDFRRESLVKPSIILIFHFPASHQRLLREHFYLRLRSSLFCASQS